MLKDVKCNNKRIKKVANCSRIRSIRLYKVQEVLLLENKLPHGNSFSFLTAELRLTACLRCENLFLVHIYPAPPRNDLL